MKIEIKKNDKLWNLGQKIVNKKIKKLNEKLNHFPKNDLEINDNELIQAHYKRWTNEAFKNIKDSHLKAFLAIGPFIIFIIASILLFLDTFDAKNILVNKLIASSFVIICGAIIIYSILQLFKSHQGKAICIYLNKNFNKQEFNTNAIKNKKKLALIVNYIKVLLTCFVIIFILIISNQKDDSTSNLPMLIILIILIPTWAFFSCWYITIRNNIRIKEDPIYATKQAELKEYKINKKARKKQTKIDKKLTNSNSKI